MPARANEDGSGTAVSVTLVEAGLGVSIVPLLPNGAVTKGRRVVIRSLAKQIRPIQSGVLLRRGEELSAASKALISLLEPPRLRRG
jgi:DNA-binding transcriptional LysR family regulator